MKLSSVPLTSDVATAEPLRTTWLSNEPAKRATEKFVLLYTPVWVAVIGIVQATGAFRHWTDWQHMVLGVGLCVPLWIRPLVQPGPEAARPFWARYSSLFNLWIFWFSFLQVYFGSALFFGTLGMEYHFHTTLIVNRTPLFLYFLTVVYFSSYYVVLSLLWRAFVQRWPQAPKVVAGLVLVVLGFAMAFAETAGMANDTLRDYFSYSDKSFVLKWGSLAYGTLFVISLPSMFGLGERVDTPLPLARSVVWNACAATTLVLVMYEIYARILPRVH